MGNTTVNTRQPRGGFPKPGVIRAESENGELIFRSYNIKVNGFKVKGRGYLS